MPSTKPSPAFPLPNGVIDQGLTKREWMAAQILAALLIKYGDGVVHSTPRAAVLAADALLEELSQ